MQVKRPAADAADENGAEDEVLKVAEEIEDTMEKDVVEWAQKDIEADIVCLIRLYSTAVILNNVNRKKNKRNKNKRSTNKNKEMAEIC